MVHSNHYDSPLGGIFLSADKIGLTELRFGMQENAPPEGDTPILASAKRWLDIYFSGQEPDFTPPLHPLGTAFQMEVWEILRTIPYGQSITYGEIARKLAARRGIPKPSAQAVGGRWGATQSVFSSPATVCWARAVCSPATQAAWRKRFAYWSWKESILPGHNRIKTTSELVVCSDPIGVNTC